MKYVNKKQGALIMTAFYQAATSVGWQEEDMATLLGKLPVGFQNDRNAGYLSEQHLIERQLTFLRVCRSLHNIANGDVEFMKHWFGSENTALNGEPNKLCRCVDGLKKVCDYLQLMETKC